MSWLLLRLVVDVIIIAGYFVTILPVCTWSNNFVITLIKIS